MIIACLLLNFLQQKLCVNIGCKIKFLRLVAWYAHGRQWPEKRRLNPASGMMAK